MNRATHEILRYFTFQVVWTLYTGKVPLNPNSPLIRSPVKITFRYLMGLSAGLIRNLPEKNVTCFLCFLFRIKREVPVVSVNTTFHCVFHETSMAMVVVVGLYTHLFPQTRLDKLELTWKRTSDSQRIVFLTVVVTVVVLVVAVRLFMFTVCETLIVWTEVLVWTLRSQCRTRMVEIVIVVVVVIVLTHRFPPPSSSMDGHAALSWWAPLLCKTILWNGTTQTRVYITLHVPRQCKIEVLMNTFPLHLRLAWHSIDTSLFHITFDHWGVGKYVRRGNEEA